MMNSSDDIVHMNPAPPLLPRSDATAQPQPEWPQHVRECPARGAQHQPNPHVHRADAGLGCNPAGVFPLAADLGQESVPSWTLFPQDFVAATPVEPDRRGAHQYPRLDLRLRQRRRKITSSLHPTLADRLLLRFGPAPDYALASEMDHRIEPRYRSWGQRSQRIPGKLPRIRSVPPYQPHNPRSLRLERSQQRRPNRPRSSGDQYPFHAVASRCPCERNRALNNGLSKPVPRTLAAQMLFSTTSASRR